MGILWAHTGAIGCVGLNIQARFYGEIETFAMIVLT